MGRLTSMAIFLIVLQAMLILFMGQAPANTPLWEIAVNPHLWNSMAFIGAITGLALGIGGAVVFLGSVAGLKTDFMVFSALIAGFISLAVPIINLALVIGDAIFPVLCPGVAGTWINCGASTWVVVVVGGTLGIYYIFTVLDWWRGRD